MIERISRRTLLVAATAPLAVPALAQGSFPDRPVRFVVGYTPGGATDIAARAFAPKMGDVLGQPVVVENRAGAGGNIALETVARSAADGHTVVLGTIGTLIINPMVMRMPVDPQRDLVPVSIAVDAFNILVVPAERPWRSVGDLVAAAKRAPGSLSWGHSGIGGSPQLAGLLLDRLAGIETVPVSYRGGALVATDLISGRIDYSFATAPSVLAHVESGKLRALAVPTSRRSRLLPDIPTVQEGGVPDFDVASWYAVLAPRGTPDGAVTRLSQAMNTALRDEEVVATLNRNGLEPMPTTPQEFATAWTRERERWAPIIRDSGIRIE
ncbi:tripartite tricarboxylate transporter substrate binding protein [Roseomonas terrae]|jgi:tripartite-type tricarboxylate transporter receptor subunit TctC|uniref:Tripartite tricarboxylate transporter substrate binding protein n=1 Tax=Neoroseomonas terrae TaxID=424799 RepID=A0ABS5EM00_9PROT|nr:tripartite tricarboxylate transporter substrate binding protein [Neoroseomonas terrae]MBR0652052.1 tripartite tricarboxylate transporter substrate binding protein [Neoroseomonas terrae]